MATNSKSSKVVPRKSVKVTPAKKTTNTKAKPVASKQPVANQAVTKQRQDDTMLDIELTRADADSVREYLKENNFEFFELYDLFGEAHEFQVKMDKCSKWLVIKYPFSVKDAYPSTIYALTSQENMSDYLACYVQSALKTGQFRDINVHSGTRVVPYV